MLDRFVSLSRIMRPKRVIPGGGSFVLGGALAGMTEFLDQAVPGEIASRWERARAGKGAGDFPESCLMAPGDVLDTREGRIGAGAGSGSGREERLAYALSLAGMPLAHERIVVPRGFRVPWMRLLARARKNLWSAQERPGLFPACDVRLEIRAASGLEEGNRPPERFVFALGCEATGQAPERRAARSEVVFHVDGGLLLMAILGAAIWNNIEIGAVIEIERSPDVCDPTIHSLMSFFIL